ncbi:hypothetical protein K439DRAFT_1641391 [Ramaria rubella]|nr:hypothetical protein K439DRAFT_1641391 [Ramaria rubella]
MYHPPAMAANSGENPIKCFCPDCGESFDSELDLSLHQLYKHSAELDLGVTQPCSIEPNSSLENLTPPPTPQHQGSSFMSKPSRKHVCDECGNRFGRIRDLEAHRRAHTVVRCK